MRLLIHYVGDIHQPLHASTRLTDKYPEGDRGGNKFKIKTIHGAYNLHSLWDSVVVEEYKDAKLPFTTSTWSSIGDTA